MAAVDVRRAYFYAELIPKTFVELPDYQDLDTWTRCCGRLPPWLYGTRQAARPWKRETEKGIKAAGMVMGKVSKCSCKSPCGKCWVEPCTARSHASSLKDAGMVKLKEVERFLLG